MFAPSTVPAGSSQESVPASSRGGPRGALLAGFLLLLVLPACSTLSRQAGPSVDWDGDREPTTFVLEVENQNFNQARIYLIHNGQRRRLGMVNGGTTQTFEVNTWGGSEIRVEVDFLAGGGFTTDALVIWPGENVVLRIPARA